VELLSSRVEPTPAVVPAETPDASAEAYPAATGVGVGRIGEERVWEERGAPVEVPVPALPLVALEKTDAAVAGAGERAEGA
jgi:hypothetical protein